jgi:hypothetical protein
VLTKEANIEKLIDQVSKWQTNFIYLVSETPEDEYLSTNSYWLANLLKLIAGLKLQGKFVLLGYSNHQMLCAASAGCDAIASGNFLNVRKFLTGDFELAPDKGPSRRSRWYYSAQLLSELKLDTLDALQDAGLLGKIASPYESDSYASVLFGGAQPSLVEFKERAAFAHYLYCLHEQSKAATVATYKDSMNLHLSTIKTAQKMLTGIKKRGIYVNRDRSFLDIADVNEAALAALDSSMGFQLEHEWGSIQWQV